MSKRLMPTVLAFVGILAPARADDTLYRYEGDVVPLDPQAGWVLADPCVPPCSEAVEDGHFVLLWPQADDIANYHYWIARDPDPPPPTLWVEWRFRSNHPFGWVHISCDARFNIRYGGARDIVNMYGDAAISFSGDDVISGLDINEFHTYRYESLDGVNYTITVDGQSFMADTDDTPVTSHYLQLAGIGGCLGDQIPNMKNEWDFVRFGTISFGEQIISTDPLSGYLDPGVYSDLDRFTVTFDSANYVYIDDITVQVTGGIAPVVTQTRRRENDEPDTVEIVLDRPLPAGQLTRFIMNDGQTTNVVEYSFVTVTTGACCTLSRTCYDLTPEGCAAIDGAEYRGDGTSCLGGTGIDDACEDLFIIPATSPWGLALTTVLILALGTLAIRRASRQRPAGESSRWNG